jgi:hypothetical protein
MCPFLFVLNFVRMNSTCPKAKWPNNMTPYSNLQRKIEGEKFYLFLITVNIPVSVIILLSLRVKVSVM